MTGESTWCALRVVPVTLAVANEFVRRHHRHHQPAVGQKFSVAVTCGRALCGVAIAGRPVARHSDDGLTLEVTRCCTDGTPNACSMLYGACARAAKALGYRRIGTFTREDESGVSLKAAGWTEAHRTDPGSWHRTKRPREDKTQPFGRVYWLRDFTGATESDAYLAALAKYGSKPESAAKTLFE